jgi:Fis family transcriptional regulator, factor for inversion stimulation protein
MSEQQSIETCIRDNLDNYFRDLVKLVEKPLLEVVMTQSGQNQSRAAEWLGLNRNTLRKKLLEHDLLK